VVVVEVDAGVEHADAGLLDLGRDGAEDRLRVAFAERGHERHQLEVGHHAGEQLAGRHLAGHHGAGDAEGLERVEQLAELADGDCAMFRGGEGRDEGRVGLLLEGHQPDLGAAGAGGLHQQGGVAPFTGDDRKGLARSEVRWEEARG
jgi:hypothetical protein